MTVTIPFGRTGMTLEDDLPGAEILESRIGELRAAGSEDSLVQEAMANPIGSPTLWELARGKKTCAIIISDHTRPVPSRHILPFLLRELREGSPDIGVTLLVATGFHRPSSAEELRQKLGDEVYEREKSSSTTAGIRPEMWISAYCPREPGVSSTALRRRPTFW